VAYQKTDHNVWVEEQRIIQEEQERIRAEKQRIIDNRNKAKDDKLNGAKNREEQRKKLRE